MGGKRREWEICIAITQISLIGSETHSFQDDLTPTRFAPLFSQFHTLSVKSTVKVCMLPARACSRIPHLCHFETGNSDIK